MEQAQWQEIAPLAEEAPQAPFPTRLLPNWLQDYVAAEADVTQTPADLAGMVSLAAISTALQGRINAVANGGGWKEPICIYTAVAMNPGERKSAVFATTIAPIQSWEEQIQTLEQQIVAESQQQHNEYEANIEATQREVGKKSAEIRALRASAAAGDTILARTAELEAARSLAIEARILFNAHRELKPMRILFDDITPEAAATHLSEQIGERIGLLSAEGGIFDILAGRYSDKPALDIFLKGHSGDSYRVDRKGRPSEVIHRPIITLGLTIQPSVLQSIGRSRDMNGRGLLARFLYVMPDTALGEREIRTQDIDAEIYGRYADAIQKIASSAYQTAEIRDIALTPEADEAIMQFQRDIEPRLKPLTGDLSPMIEWASKLSGAILRIAVLISIARNEGIPDQIEEEDIIRAAGFAPYLEAHARKAYAHMGILDGYDNLESRTLRQIKRLGWADFTGYELRRATHAERDTTPEETEEVLGRLADRHYLRQEAVTLRRSRWIVNPALFQS